ncbi:MAG: pentapeptide repeat-containing protein [Gammaproteobacteria bacterium]|nr:pentapeptide repeat-containing protein [Gammaproteobacteria bacterium]
MNMNKYIGLIAITAFLTSSLAGFAAGVNVGDGAVKVDEDGVSVGGGIIKVTPEGVRVPGVEVNTGSKTQAGAKTRVGSAAGQIFNGTDFSDANMNGRDFSGGRFIGVDFSDADLSNVNFDGAQFQGVDFGDTILAGAFFINARFQGDDFSDADLTGANFTDADFQGADFSNAKLQGTCFVRARLVGNDFRNAKLDGAVFTDATRIGNDFGDTDLSGVIWKGPSSCPHGQEAMTRPEVTTSATIARALAQGKDAKVDLTVNFEFDSDTIRAEGHAQVLEIANALKSAELANQRVMIEGHTDSVGNDDYNRDLSYRRAIVVMRALTEQYDIDHSRLQVRGFGESRPIATNDKEDGRALNRRVTLVNLGHS